MFGNLRCGGIGGTISLWDPLAVKSWAYPCPQNWPPPSFLVLLPPNQLWFPLPAYILVCPVALTPESIVSDVNWSLRLNESL